MTIPTRAELDAMTPREVKSLETRLRRAAERRGYRLEKSRRRDPAAYDYGTYQLVYADGAGWPAKVVGTAVFDAPGGLSLIEVGCELYGVES
jgi:hypothetical protein